MDDQSLSQRKSRAYVQLQMLHLPQGGMSLVQTQGLPWEERKIPVTRRMPLLEEEY